MKLRTKLTALSIGLALPLTIVSCKEAEKKVAEIKQSIPTDTNGVIGIFEKMSIELEGVTDLESAKQSIPALESSGDMLKKGIAAIGGEKKMEAIVKASPDLQAKFAATMIKLKEQLDRIEKASPEAYKFMDQKMDAIMK